jgi:fatty acid desaturase
VLLISARSKALGQPANDGVGDGVAAMQAMVMLIAMVVLVVIVLLLLLLLLSLPLPLVLLLSLMLTTSILHHGHPKTNATAIRSSYGS